jgi:hypothetical protein
MIIAGFMNFVVRENKEETSKEIIEDIEALRLSE